MPTWDPPLDVRFDHAAVDRLAQTAGGRVWRRQPWSTPVGEYRQYGPWRLPSRGEGRWHPPGGEFVYIELELLDVQTDPPPVG